MKPTENPDVKEAEKQPDFNDQPAASQPAAKEKPKKPGFPSRKRHAPLYQYRKEIEKVAVVPVNNSREGETSEKSTRQSPESPDHPSRPQLPPLPRPPKYHSRLGVFELDLTYPSFRIRREARRAKEAAARGQTDHATEEPQPSTSSTRWRPRTHEEDDQLYNHYYSCETTVSTSPEWISSSEDESRP